jgi:hypothetical protein
MWSEDGCVWAVGSFGMNKQVCDPGSLGLYASDHTYVKTIARAAFSPDLASKKAVCVGRHQTDIRMLVQQGAFTIHSDADDLVQLSGEQGWLIKYVVPASSKRRLVVLLDQVGVNRESLFPDLANLAAAIQAWRR